MGCRWLRFEGTAAGRWARQRWWLRRAQVDDLVGSPETVAAAILDYVDRGASLVSIRGYDTLADAVDYGRFVLPLVRQEIAHRKATGERGRLQAENLGNYGREYGQYATAQASH